MTHERDRQRPAADDGISLIEVIVAMLIFAIVASGIASGTVATLRFTADGKAREVATNLAAAALDAVRSAADPMAVEDSTSTTRVGGVTYTLVRSLHWASSATGDSTCSAGSISYKTVQVAVTWPGMLATTRPVRSDTIISSAGRTSDAVTGTVFVSVQGADGSPESGVRVALTPTSGGAPLAGQPTATDTHGCTFGLKVAPGTYSVTVTRSGGIGSDQTAVTTQPVTVVAGQTVGAAFQYDVAATLGITYGQQLNGRAAPVVPDHLDLTLSSPGAVYPLGASSSLRLYPFPAGYVGIAGALGGGPSTGCAAVDPSNWPAGSVQSKPLAAGARAAAVAPPAGGAASMTVPMGEFTLDGAAGRYLTAVSNGGPSGSGNPGCAVGMTYTFDTAITGTGPFALPYGSWTLYLGASKGARTTAVAGSKIQVLTNEAPDGVVSNAQIAGATGDVMTLDPRRAP